MSSKLLIFVFLSFLFSSALIILSIFLSSKIVNLLKVKAYECGFKNFDQNARQGLNVHFLFVGIIFLLFDLEVVLLLPWAVNFSRLSYNGLYSILIFLILLIISYWYELKEGLFN